MIDNNNNKVVTLGEILLRLTPPGYLKFQQSMQLQATFGGSETNVAVSLAHFGINSSFVTRLPQNDIAEACLSNLRSHNVSTEDIIFGGDRLGLYYMESTASMRAANVVYDRAGSSYCTMQPGMIDWNRIFATANWFHWSGIGPSLSQSAADVTMEAIDAAIANNLTISADLNWRKNLWKYGKQAEEIMPALAKKSHVLFGTETEFQKAFGTDIKGFKVSCPEDEASFSFEKYRENCEKIMEQAPLCKYIFIALRNVVDAKRHVLTGVLYTREGDFYHSPIYHIHNVVDAVGCGDAFCAGIIYGLLHYPNDVQNALNFACAAATLKNTITGDYNLSKVKEVEALMVTGDAEISR